MSENKTKNLNIIFSNPTDTPREKFTIEIPINLISVENIVKEFEESGFQVTHISENDTYILVLKK